MPVYSCESPAERPPGARQGAGWNWEVPIGATKAAARLKLGKATIKPTTTAIKKSSLFGCGMLVAAPKRRLRLLRSSCGPAG